MAALQLVRFGTKVVDAQEEYVNRNFASCASSFQTTVDQLGTMDEDLPQLVRSIKQLRMVLPSDTELTDHSRPIIRQVKQDVAGSNQKAVDFLGSLVDVKSSVLAFKRALSDLILKFQRDYICATGSARFVAWSPEQYQDEIRCIDKIAKRTIEHFTALDAYTRMVTSPSLEELEDCMCQCALQDKDQLDQLAQKRAALKEIAVTAAQDRGRLAAAELHVQHLQAESEKERADMQSIQEHVSSLKRRKSVLEEAMRAGNDDLQDKVSAVQAHFEESHETLCERRTQQLMELRENRKARQVELQKAQAKIEKDMLETPAMRYANHTVLVLDRSGSMLGQPWALTKAAAAAFCEIRMKEGCAERVSMLAFNGGVEVLCCGEELNSSTAKHLDRVQPCGGTNFVPAWQQVLKCAESTYAGFRLVVIFMTDGKAPDISGAEAIAQQLHEARRQMGGMVTFVVSASHDRLTTPACMSPLVKAGNGGRLHLQMGAERVELYVPVEHTNLVDAYSKIACTVSFEHMELRAKGAAIDALRHTLDQRLTQGEADLWRLMDRAEQSSQEGARSWQAALKQNYQEQRALVAENLAQTEAELTKCSKQAKDQVEKCCQLERCLTAACNEFKKWEDVVQGNLEVDEGAKEVTRSGLRRLLQETKDRELSRWEMLKKVGTADARRALALHGAMETYGHCTKSMWMLAKNVSSGLSSMGDLLDLVASQIQKPLDVDSLRLSKPDVVADDLLTLMKIEPQKIPSSLSNFRRFLTAKATDDLQLARPEKSVELLVRCFSWSDLCSNGREAADLANKKKECEKLFKAALKRQSPTFKKQQEKSEKAKESMDAIKGELERVQMQLREQTENGATQRLERDAERLERKLEIAESELEKLTDQMGSEEERIMRQNEDPLFLLGHAIKECHEAFKRFASQRELHFLESKIIGHCESVVKPLTDFMITVERTEAAFRQVICPEEPKGPERAPCAGAGRAPRGLLALLH